MAKSKQRKGHREKIATRNLEIKKRESAMKKLFTEAMKTQIEELKKKYEAESGTTQNPQ